MKKLGVGIVGTGWVSDEYIRSFSMNPHTQIRAICSRTMEKAKAKAIQHNLNDCKTFIVYEEMLEQQDIDIICVLTPNFLHAEQTILAAQAKKHIVIEKPLAVRWEDMLRMQKTIHENNITLFAAFPRHWSCFFICARNRQY